MHCADICLSATHNESARKLVMTQFEPCQYRHKSRYASVLQNRCFYTYIWLAYLVRFFERLLRQTTPKLLPLFECLPLLFLLMSLRYSDGPNIKGSINNADGGNFVADGCFRSETMPNVGYTIAADHTNGSSRQTFIASRSNSTYSDSVSTVQPASLYGLYLIRAYQA